MEAEECKKYIPGSNFFFCNLCKVYCASATNLQSHFLGLKHRAVEEALKTHCLVKAPTASEESSESLPQFIYTENQQGETLEEQLNACKDSEPVIGLEYITEYRTEDSLLYDCTLCIFQGRLTNMFMHVLGIKHKVAYLKKHHPEIGEVKGRGPRLSKRLKAIASQIEKVEGRKRIKSSVEIPVQKEDIYSVQQSDFLVTWFSEEDKAKKIEFPKPSVKKAEDAEAANIKYDDSNKSGEEKDQEQQQNAWLLDSDSDSEEFANNEELLKYLESFEIVDEDDAAFVLKVTQKFTEALVVYREKAAERKNIQELEQYSQSPHHSKQKTSLEAVPNLKPYNKPLDHSDQKTSLKTLPELKPYNKSSGHSKPKAFLDPSPYANNNFSQWEFPTEHSFEEMEKNSNVKIPAKRKASGMSTISLKDKVKTCKPAGFVPTFQEIANEEDSCDAEGPSEPQGLRPTFRHARGKSPGAALHYCQGKKGKGRGKKAGQKQYTMFSSRGRKGAPSSHQRQYGRPPFGPSQSDSEAVGKISRSIKNMDVDEVTGTLQKISETNPAFSVPVRRRKTVWIIGHSIVYRAGDYAASSGWGPALGLEDRLQVKWMGQRRMQWDFLLPTISSQVSCLGSPDAIIIHLGEDDLSEQKGVDLTVTMSADLHTLISRLPNTRLFWSDLLERRDWHNDDTPEKVELIRKKVTTAAGQLIEATGGFVIQHPDITFRQAALYRVDGVNLTEWGMDIWLHGIRDGLLCWLQS